jgi:hypothetical protein
MVSEAEEMTLLGGGKAGKCLDTAEKFKGPATEGVAF